MAQIYQSFEFKPGDTLEERMTKLYLGIISIGEDLYCKGSAVNEFNKDLTRYEKEIAQMRRELAALKEQVKQLKQL